MNRALLATGLTIVLLFCAATARAAPLFNVDIEPALDVLTVGLEDGRLVYGCFHVHGESIEVEVINPDTMEEIDRFVLK